MDMVDPPSLYFPFHTRQHMEQIFVYMSQQL